MRLFASLAMMLLLGVTLPAQAQDGAYQAEVSNAPVPEAIKGPVKAALKPEGLLIKGSDGKPFVTLWTCSAVPASAKPSGPKGAVLFPFLEPGQLIGAIEFAVEGQDYRDQAISPGVYTLRYGLQPVNGDHLGVSKYRDYLLLVPAAMDADVATIPQKKLDKTSTEASGTNHPAVMILFAAPEGSKTAEMVHDQERDLWGVVFSLPIQPNGEPSASPLPVQLIISGAAMP